MHENQKETGKKFSMKDIGMPCIRVRGIEKVFADNVIFSDVSFDILSMDRIGLVGLNGTGKTTLANILYGDIYADKGSIERLRESFKIGYLHQSADNSVNNIQDQYNKFEEGVMHKTSMLGLQKVQEWNRERLTGISGGEKLKLSLAKVWATNPDMLILDEPTNHLDMHGLDWLLTELKTFHGPVLIISHDRHFLDITANRIFELERGKLEIYKGNYTDYREEKDRNYEIQLHQYNEQQKLKERIEHQMSTLSSWSDKAHQQSTKQSGFKEYHRVKAKKMDQQVKSKMNRLKKELEKNKVDKPEEKAEVMFQFDASGKRGKRVIEAKNLSKRFGERVLFEKSNFYIKHGENVGILGGNGAGKTTFIRMLLGEAEVTEGELWKSPSVKIAYLSQDLNDLPLNKNALQALGLTEREALFNARTLLANLGLNEDKLTRPIGQLSFGERIRIKLTDMLLQEYDVLILDEPTNHLDLPSREQFEKTLSKFAGTLIVVSHDIYFLKKLSSRLLVFENNNIRRLEMGLDEFQSKKQQVEKKRNQKLQEQELMLINNRITALLGELSVYSQDDEKYLQLDKEFKRLLAEKKKLMGPEKE